MALTNTISISFFGSAEIEVDVVTGGINDGKVIGFFINGNPVDPTSTDWDKIAASDEAKFIVNQFNGTVNQPLRFVTEEELKDAYEIRAKSIGNRGVIDAKNLNERSSLTSGRRSGRGGRERDLNRSNQFSLTAGRRRAKQLTSTLAYPLDIDKKQDYLQIDQFEYRPPQGSGSPANPKFPTRGKKYGGTVILPMPKVSDSNGADWAENQLNVFGLGALGLASSAGGSLNPFSTPEERSSSQSKFVEQLRGGMTNAPGAAGAAGAIMGAGMLSNSPLATNISPDQLLARTTGNIINPNAELLFKGPTLRQFSFSYIMVARNKLEGANIRRIIKFFKDGLAPKKLDDVFLGTPNIFALKYNTRNGNRSVNKFKDMALSRFTVDYAPSGFWTSYEDSQPVAVKIQFDFTELQPIYKQDQDEFNGDDVGY